MKFLWELYRRILEGERVREEPSGELEVCEAALTKTRVARGQKRAAEVVLFRAGNGANGNGVREKKQGLDTLEIDVVPDLSTRMNIKHQAG